jgi:hypothetical protein
MRKHHVGRAGWLRNHSNNVIQAAELNWIELTALTRSLQNKNQKKNLGFADTGAFCHEIRAGNIPARNITSKKRTSAKFCFFASRAN